MSRGSFPETHGNLFRCLCGNAFCFIRAEGEDFVILAPRRDEHFQAEVLVQPLGDWELVRPTTNPFNMKGGDAQGYEAKLEPEDERSGTIFFHNYCVRSDWGDGEKDVVVPAGTTVVFTASKNGEPAPSDWTVDGVLVETNKTSYTFNAPVSEPRFLSIQPNPHWRIPEALRNRESSESPGRTASSLNRRKGVQRGRRAKSFTRSLVRNSL